MEVLINSCGRWRAGDVAARQCGVSVWRWEMESWGCGCTSMRGVGEMDGVMCFLTCATSTCWAVPACVG